MPRQARVVAAGLPHHVVQRGVRRQQVFFSEKDYRLYVRLLGTCCQTWGVSVWAYCLMPNHVHLVVVPAESGSLAAALGRAHQQYAAYVNRREKWAGHLWQERFSSALLNDRHLLAAVRYVENNPVRAGLAESPGAYPWSSAPARLRQLPDGLIENDPFEFLLSQWDQFLASRPADSPEPTLGEGSRDKLPASDQARIIQAEGPTEWHRSPRRRGRPPNNGACPH